MAGLCLAGWLNILLHTQPLSVHDLRNQLPDEPVLASVRGQLLETPSQRVFMRDGSEVWRTLARIKVSAVNQGTNWQPASGQIVVTTPGILPGMFFGGQEVQVAGILASPGAPVAEGLLDYRTYLKRQGIYFELKNLSTNEWHLLSTNVTPPVSDRFLSWSQKTLARGLPEVDEPLKLLWAMTLGWRPALTDEVSAPFMESGTMHIFAISGLHIALIAGILAALFRAVQLPRFWCGVLIIPIIWFYTGATGWQPSAIRSTIMMTIVIGGWMLRRPGDLLNSLAAAALVILLLDPLQLFQASFQLSFFVVLSIALFMPPLEKFRDRLLQVDPLLPPELLPRWRRGLNFAGRIVLTSLAVSFAAWLGSWPLCAYYFHIFSPITLLANLLVVPLSSAALASNLGSLICGDWLPWLTELFNHSGWLWMKWMIGISNALVKWPHAYFYVRSPTLPDFTIYYIALIGLLSGFFLRKEWRGVTIVFVVVIVCFYGWHWNMERQITTITVLPLNGGHAVFVQGGKSSENLLVDCGDSNSVEFVTAPFLHAQGINHLPRFVLTQGDMRDVGGAMMILDLFSAGEVFTSAANFRSRVYRETMNVLKSQSGRRRIVNPGDSVGGWLVVYPPATNDFSQADDNALVLSREIHGVKILLLSDLGRQGQGLLLSQTNELKADIVVTGLPEKSQPLSEALLERIQPKVIIVADSLLPATRRAPKALQERLAEQKCEVIYTRTAGAVTVVIRPEGWELRTMDGTRTVKGEK